MVGAPPYHLEFWPIILQYLIQALRNTQDGALYVKT